MLREKGLRGRNSPTCTLSQNGYGEAIWHSTFKLLLTNLYSMFNTLWHDLPLFCKTVSLDKLCATTRHARREEAGRPAGSISADIVTDV